MELIDPAISVHGALLPEIAVLAGELPFDAGNSIAGFADILFGLRVFCPVYVQGPRALETPGNLWRTRLPGEIGHA